MSSTATTSPNRLAKETRLSSARRRALVAALGLGAVVVFATCIKDRAVEEWNLYRLGSPDRETRIEAMKVLGDLHSTRAVPRLLDECEEADDAPMEEFSKRLATLANRRTGPSAEEILAVGLDHLNQVSGADWAAAEALGSMGSVAVPYLVEALRERSDRVQYFTIRALGYMEQGVARDAIPDLLAQLTHEEENHRYAAAQTLASIGVASDEVISGLVACLRDPERWVRAHAAESLGIFGRRAERSLTQLRLLLQDPEEIVRLAASVAMVNIGVTAESVESVRAILSSANPDGAFGDEAVAALKGLEDGGRGSRPEVGF